MRMPPNFISMRKTPEDLAEERACPPCDFPHNLYPYGLCISFDEETLERLDLDDNVDVGDMIDMRVLAKITCVTKNETDQGIKIRVEMQITDVALENESHDSGGTEMSMERFDYRKFYNDAN